MIKIVSAAQMREIDRVTVEEYGIPETILMENAGLQTLYYLEELLESLDGKRIAIFCGKGNNGGDGFVTARHLHIDGIETTVYLLAEKKELKGDAKLNMLAFEKIGGKIKEILKEVDIKKHKIPIMHADAHIDALLGTGLNSELKGVYKAVVEKINEWSKFCLSVDIPTGLHSDKGASLGLHVHADATITFGYPMTGMLSYPAASSVGELNTVNISFPQEVLDASPCDAYLLDDDWAHGALPERPANSHKGTYGHAVVVGGSTGMGGAVGMASLSALKVGAGLVTAAVPHSLSLQLEMGIPEVMSYHLGNDLENPENADAIIDFAKDKSALLIGPGMGRGGKLTELLANVVAKVAVPIVIDADGLNNLAPVKEILKKTKTPAIVTPHPGEMSRLTGLSTEEINSDRINVAKNFSKEFNCVTVLKGARTVIATPEATAYVNPTGNPNLASGGTGDVLSGMIVGYLAQGLAAHEAAALAVFLHGLTADMYTEDNDPYSMTATDIIALLPKVLHDLLEE